MEQISRLILPSMILAHFEVTGIKEGINEKNQEPYIEITLEEKNEIPTGYNQEEYESKGFTQGTRIQDFPIRGKEVYLIIKRRRWRQKSREGKEIYNNYSFIAEGTKMTKELADFLKEASR